MRNDAGARSSSRDDGVIDVDAGNAALGDPAALELVAIRAAEAASTMVREKLGNSRILDTKSSPTDVVTEADVEVEAVVRQELEAATPGASLHGEERGVSAGTTDIGWIIDPIDGTVNFVYDLPVMGVSIAATVDGKVVAGAVADVVRREVFSASAGNGARRNGIQVSPSTVTRLDEALVGTGFSYSAAERRREGDIVARVLPAARDIRCFGSSALHLCWIGCGRLDAYYQRAVMDYDVAAAAIVASEAGARVELLDAPDGTFVIAASVGLFEVFKALVSSP